MEVEVDGVIYHNRPYGGVSRIFTEILPRMCQIDPTLQITLFTSGRSLQILPKNPGIKHRALFPVDDLLRPRRFWRPIRQPVRRLAQRTALGSSSGTVWHSSYFTMPMNWKRSTEITVHDMIYERYPDFFPNEDDERFRRGKRSCVLAADKVICVSETTREDVQAFYDINEAKLHIIPIGFCQNYRKLNHDERSFDHHHDKPFLLFVGKRDFHKNFKTLLQAYCVWQRGNEVDLLVVGADWSDQERKWLSEWGCVDQVYLVSNVDDHQLVCLYNDAQALVYPSFFEGLGIPLLEAIACGCPVVASRIPSTMEVAGEHPFYFEPTDVDDLLAALDAALSEGRQSVRVESGISRAQQYSWDKTAKKTLQVYRSLTGT